MNSTIIRRCDMADLDRVRVIYNHYVEHTVVTFEEALITEEEMRRRYLFLNDRYPWYVCECAGTVVGFAYARPYHARTAFRYTAETSIYVQAGMESRGIGRSLYRSILPELSRVGVHVGLASISLPNDRSVGLHEALGFEKAGNFRSVGRKFGQWIDVGYWQTPLPRPDAASDGD